MSNTNNTPGSKSRPIVDPLQVIAAALIMEALKKAGLGDSFHVIENTITTERGNEIVLTLGASLPSLGVPDKDNSTFVVGIISGAATAQAIPQLASAQTKRLVIDPAWTPYAAGSAAALRDASESMSSGLLTEDDVRRVFKTLTDVPQPNCRTLAGKDAPTGLSILPEVEDFSITDEALRDIAHKRGLNLSIQTVSSSQDMRDKRAGTAF